MKRLEVFLRKIILRLLLLFSKRRKTDETLKIGPGSKVLCIRLNRIGDALVSTSFLHQLKAQTNCTLHILADKKNHFVFEHNDDIEKVFIFDKRLSALPGQLKHFNLEHYDAVIDLHDDVSTTVSLLISLIDSKWKLGLEKENSILYTHTVPKLDSKKSHVIDRLSELHTLTGIESDRKTRNIYFPLPEESRKTVSDFLEANFESGKSLIGVNISAGSDARYWGTENFVKLLRFLIGKNFQAVLLSAPNDQDKVDAIIADINTQSENAVKLFSANNYHTFAAMIASLNALFTPDTAVVHLASAYLVPVFGLYVHDTDDTIWYPYQSEFDWIETREHTLSNIRFEDVIKKFESFLYRDGVQQLEL